MPQTLPLSFSLTNGSDHLSNEELIVLEAECLSWLYEEMLAYFQASAIAYAQLLKSSTEKENTMLENNFLRCIVNDILKSNEYTLNGIAYYTDSSKDVIEEILLGINQNPSLTLAKKLIDLHRSIRPDLYKAILAKAVHSQQLA